MQFTDDEIETLKEILSDWGSDCPDADYAKVHAIGVKLGVWEEEKPPTEEEIKRREEFAKSPLGLIMSEMFKRTNDFMAKQLLEENELSKFFKSSKDNNYQWPENIQTQLKIRLPSDFAANKIVK